MILIGVCCFCESVKKTDGKLQSFLHCNLLNDRILVFLLSNNNYRRLAGWLLPVWPFSWKLWVAVSLTFAIGVTSLLLTNRLQIPTGRSYRKGAVRQYHLNRNFSKKYFQKTTTIRKHKNNVMLIVGGMFLSQSVALAVWVLNMISCPNDL